MSCICQYIVNSTSAPNGTEIRVSFGVTTSSETEPEAPVPSQNVSSIETAKEAVTDDTKIAVCVSELAKFRAENWLLKKKLHDYEVTIDNLEQLMSTIVNKQHQVLSDMIQLRKRNNELETECNLQREYHAIERNSLIKQVHELKTMSKDHSCSMSGEDEEDLNQTADSQEYDKQLMETESDEDCRYGHDSDEDDVLSTISSVVSTGPSSTNSSPYSTASESEDTEGSDDDVKESQNETESD
ncbi:uncharacterized protein LOC117783858 [Drosophila innubila]|uniref:uncharacterized protein LOC117783858 n=1 Tax=Drosophila innubila TaxID=198719 RepID=UPI00148BA080|nr:uncharacterized protein LOC117783858 [Drosophila innubila]XP_034477303.1 uncharacterized protein LOC117783858 [Drosophila innubila]